MINPGQQESISKARTPLRTKCPDLTLMKIPTMTNTHHPLGRGISILAGIFLAGTVWGPTASASVLLEFEHGGSSAVPVTDEVDAFTGQAGGGWSGAWTLREQTTGNSVYSAAVIDTNPFASGTGNYLQVNYESLNSSNSRAGVSRQFSTNPGDGGVNPNAVFSLAFDFRVDAFSGSMEASGNQFNISTGVTNATSGFATSSPLRIWYLGGTGWLVNDGDAYVSIPDLAVPITAGEAYNFNITIDPTDGTWDIAVQYDGGTYGLTDLDLRAGTDVAQANYLSIRGLRPVGETLSWSIDNIQAVPEPGSLVLCLGGLAVLAALRRRRSPR